MAVEVVVVVVVVVEVVEVVVVVLLLPSAHHLLQVLDVVDDRGEEERADEEHRERHLQRVHREAQRAHQHHRIGVEHHQLEQPRRPQHPHQIDDRLGAARHPPRVERRAHDRDHVPRDHRHQIDPPERAAADRTEVVQAALGDGAQRQLDGEEDGEHRVDRGRLRRRHHAPREEQHRDELHADRERDDDRERERALGRHRVVEEDGEAPPPALRAHRPEALGVLQRALVVVVLVDDHLLRRVALQLAQLLRRRRAHPALELGVVLLRRLVELHHRLGGGDAVGARRLLADRRRGRSRAVLREGLLLEQVVERVRRLEIVPAGHRRGW